MSINWPHAEPAPRILVLPRGAVDLGEADAAIEMWEHYSHKQLDETQKLAVRVMMAQGPGGKWAAATTGREMPRQNGKGDEIEVVELWGLVQRSEAIMHTIHDAVLLATQTQQRMLGLLDSHHDLSRLVRRKWTGTGQQMIELSNGGAIWYRTRSGGGGRGMDDTDRLVVDEAQHATTAQLSAVSPTLLANSNPQLNALGTAGLDGVSDWWWEFRKRALSDDPGSFGYVGHTAEEVTIDAEGIVTQSTVDVYDRTGWPTCNPATTRNADVMEFLEGQLRLLGPESFGREHLCVWDAPRANERTNDGPEWRLVDEATWSARGAGTPGAGWLADPVVFAVEMTVDASPAWCAVSVAGKIAGSEMVGFDLVEHRKGTEWVVDYVAALLADDPAASVVMHEHTPDLPRQFVHAGVPVTLTTVKDMKAAIGGMHVALVEGTAQHRDDDEMTDAVAFATPKFSGDSMMIDRKASDATPIVAAALARWALLSGAGPSVYESRGLVQLG